MKHLLAFICLLTLHTCLAQETPPHFDIRLGIGSSILGTGDHVTLSLENELNYRLHPYITISPSILYARSSDIPENDVASLVQGNLNIFISPFKNIGKHDFRIGGGPSIQHISAVSGITRFIENGIILEENWWRENTAWGFSAALEYSRSFGGKFLAGIKLFGQAHAEDTNQGFMVKMGVKL